MPIISCVTCSASSLGSLITATTPIIKWRWLPHWWRRIAPLLDHEASMPDETLACWISWDLNEDTCSHWEIRIIIIRVTCIYIALKPSTIALRICCPACPGGERRKQWAFRHRSSAKLQLLEAWKRLISVGINRTPNSNKHNALQTW